jgi:hypothetical protein
MLTAALPHCRANVTVQASSSQFVGCKPQLFLSKMQPYLSLAPGSPGYTLGAAAAASNASGLVWSQGLAALMAQSSSAAHAQLQVQAGPLVLPGGVSLQVRAAAAVRTCGPAWLPPPGALLLL